MYLITDETYCTITGHPLALYLDTDLRLTLVDCETGDSLDSFSGREFGDMMRESAPHKASGRLAINW